VDKVSSMVNSFHDLWSLPVQIGIAFLLLYLQVNVAFIAGVIIIIGNVFDVLLNDTLHIFY
jgi:ATP-binding cassette subfamily C (CFTR/MRP) protein 10